MLNFQTTRRWGAEEARPPPAAKEVEVEVAWEERVEILPSRQGWPGEVEAAAGVLGQHRQEETGLFQAPEAGVGKTKQEP